MINHTIRKAFEYYAQEAKVEDSTRNGARNVGRKLEAHDIFDLELYKLNPATIRQFIHSLNVMESTAFNQYRILTAVITFYVRSHALPIRLELINSVFKTPNKKSADSDDFNDGGYLTLSEVGALTGLELNSATYRTNAKSSETQIRDYFLVMCFSGMAISDLVKFTPEVNIKEENGKMWLKYRRAKNNNLCRIPLSIPEIPIMEIINRLTWPVPFDKRTAQIHIAKLGEKFGKRLHPHLGRHTFGSVMLEVGFSMDAVRAMMGHSSITTTERIYAKVSQDKIERELNAINQKLPQKV